MSPVPSVPLRAAPARRFFRPEDLPELHAAILRALHMLGHAQDHLPAEEYAARWLCEEHHFLDVESAFREVVFPSPGLHSVSMEPGAYASTFNFVAHRMREAVFSLELLFAQLTGNYSHEWLLAHAPATLGPAPWLPLLLQAHAALGHEPMPELAAPADNEDPELASAVLLGLLREALDTLGWLASRPLFLQLRQDKMAAELRLEVLSFVRRCLGYATAYRTSHARTAQLLGAASAKFEDLCLALESWEPGLELDDSTAETLTTRARACLEELELHPAAGDWDTVAPPAGRKLPSSTGREAVTGCARAENRPGDRET